MTARVTVPLAPVVKTRILRGRRGLETWGAETPDGEWGMDRVEDAATSCTDLSAPYVPHKPKES